MTEQKYGVIYADPPWSFRNWSEKGEGRNANQHYPTMEKEDIQRMGVSDIADKDCILFLWVTFPCLLDGFELITKWGFEYKTVAFVWVKRNKNDNYTNFIGLGHWTRSNAEIVLLATKGKPKRTDKGVRQIVETFEDFETETLSFPVGKHSQKPHEVRTRIERLCGDVPRVELFARQRYPHWHAFGNEVKDSIEIPNATIQKPHYKSIQQQLL